MHDGHRAAAGSNVELGGTLLIRSVALFRAVSVEPLLQIAPKFSVVLLCSELGRFAHTVCCFPEEQGVGWGVWLS